MKTKIVNIRKSKYDVYIGRPSGFGNPFSIGKHGDRDMVIGLYKEWFSKMIKNDIFKSKIIKLKGKTLGCFCKPQGCHGDVIVDYLENNNE